MILQWIAYAALCSALVAVTAWSIDHVFAAIRRPRRMVWIVALGTSVIAPVALALRPHAPSPSAPSAPGIAAAPSAAPESASTSNQADLVFLSFWAVASSAFALVLVVAHRRTTAALRTCRKTTIAGSHAFVSADFGPAVIGVLRHHIVVPSWTLGLPDDDQRLVVAHELEHARSGDPLLALAGVCAVVVMPWNPALWWQLSRLRLAIELDCDARVIARKAGDAIAYSRLLVSVGERSLATRQPVLAMSRSRSSLAKRFDALLKRDTVRPRRVLALSLLAAGTAASLAFLPPPNVSNVVDLVRPHQPVVVASPRLETPNQNQLMFRQQPEPTVGAVARRPAPAPRVRNRLTAIGDAKSLPPVNVVPSTPRGPLDSVVVTSAARPPLPTLRGGVLMAAPGGGGGGGGRGGFRATATATPVGPDSNAVIRAGRGGRAVVVARPDTAAFNRR
jgi:beta-lactamase regulating signal transducer with metallopeptidase domain